MTGTKRARRPDIPTIMDTASGREIFSSKFLFSQQLAMVSYVLKKNKVVRVLSTYILDNSLSDKHHRKLIMILHYNDTKGRIDNADKLICEYSCARRISRWTFRLFMNMLDIAALNSYIIWITKNPDWNETKHSRRYHFLLALGKEISLEHITRRASNPNGLHTQVLRVIEATGAQISRSKNAVNVERTSTIAGQRRRGRCTSTQEISIEK